MNAYLGMRWFKCDLHVHTPEDSQNWRDKETKLGEPRRPTKGGTRCESDIQEKARKYLHRCHDVGLHVIGVTEHNFSSKSDLRDWFVLHLVEQNSPVAKERGVDKLHILPGFEVDIGYHVLCLFNLGLGADLPSIHRFLTKLGLPESERFTSGRPNPLRYHHENVSLKRLIEMVQGTWGGMVITAHADQKNGLLSDASNKEDYKNPDLYCVELTQNPPADRYKDILAGNARPNWERKHFNPAWISSSDAKSLAMDEKRQPVVNSLGYRYTWIKMSHPSIEALRQAFLDPSSRVRPGGDDPSQQDNHARILSASISNSDFLADQTLVFSPNLNCIIGGRGSGKSAILEGMRLTMGKDADPTLNDQTREKVERIRKLLTKSIGEKTRINWRNADGVEDILVYSVPQVKEGTCRVEGRKMQDLSSFLKDLPIQFFSQQQLHQITAPEKNALLTLLDAFAKEELKPLEHQERVLRQEITQLFNSMATLEQTERDLSRMQQEAVELDRQWTARAALQDDALRHQGLKAESAYLQRLSGSLKEDASRLMTVVDDICETHAPLGSTTDRWPHGVWFREKDEQVLQAKEVFKGVMDRVVGEYRMTVQEIFTKDPEWQALKQQLDHADEIFSQACATKNMAPGDVNRMQEISQKRTRTKQALEKIIKDRGRLQRLQQQLPEKFQALHETWRARYEVRKRMAEEITQSAMVGNKPMIKLLVSYGSEKTAFDAIWQQLHRDRRTRLGSHWIEIGTIMRDAFLEHDASQEEDKDGFFSLWDMLQHWMDHDHAIPEDIRTALSALSINFDDIKALLSGSSRKIWQDVRVTHVEDSVDLALYSKEGDRKVGQVSDETLSEGQRNTAVLAMLLARGTHPLVIDQPEDELDSRFIFRELVPMLRQLKNTRQIILTTHNANLPVNGDAEWVYALETVDGRGVKLAEGGLDQPRVTTAVLDIMEGSAQAFRQRKAKYHF